MKTLISLTLCAVAACAMAQQHDLKVADQMPKLAFLKGHWVGKQVFNTGGAAMVGDAKNDIDIAIGGRYIYETLSTSLPGRTPSDTRHFISYDIAAKTYKAWWFTDTTNGPMELNATLDGTKLTMLNKVVPGGRELRFTYNVTGDTFVYTFEMKQEGKWVLLFTTTYQRAN